MNKAEFVFNKYAGFSESSVKLITKGLEATPGKTLHELGWAKASAGSREAGRIGERQKAIARLNKHIDTKAYNNNFNVRMGKTSKEDGAALQKVYNSKRQELSEASGAISDISRQPSVGNYNANDLKSYINSRYN